MLKETNPTSFEARKNDTLDKTNPIPYFAPTFGYKGHIDQNEKLVRYGVVHAVFRDGFSGSIESWITLPSKNPIQLYSKFYRYVDYKYHMVNAHSPVENILMSVMKFNPNGSACIFFSLT